MSSAVTPSRIGPYELVSRLGEGGMAETYVAVRRGPGAFAQRVCLKRLRPELEGDPEFVRQFMVEAEIAARMRHAAIAQVLDFGQDGADYYLALELVEGCDLRQLLRASGGALPPALVLHVAIELATALDVAHRAGATPRDAVVHRDVSPSNTLVSIAGEVKLTDFGIARVLGGPHYTRTGIVKGKVPYMAPEYARSERLDPRSDLFSLGVLLYECACGARPHDGATDLETLERASRGQHTALAERVPALSRDFCDMIERLLDPDPELRPPSASALLAALLSLPAPARARLELGALVADAVRARAAKRESSPAAEASPPTEIMDPGPSAPATRTRRSDVAASSALVQSGGDLVAEPDFVALRFRAGRRSLIALAFALLCALSVLAFALLRQPADRARAELDAGRSPSLTRTAEDSPAGAAPNALGAALPSVVVGPEQGSAPPQAARTEPAPVAIGATEAWLEVIVLPYGEVSVDGKPVGKAPIALASEPGEHVIEARSRGNTLRRHVTLVPGQRKQVVMK
jgi:eukaryotic-like serine/threonine-protein kinase